MPTMGNFAAFILSHGRPDNVKTYATLRRFGYTGRIVIIVDDQDSTMEQYRRRYGAEVYIFDKAAAIRKTDMADNFESYGTPLYARNMCHDIARELGLEHFIELDDDYSYFEYRFDGNHRYGTGRPIRSLDSVFEALTDFYKYTPVLCVAMAQGGDFIGGRVSKNALTIQLTRKAMNSFLCGVDRPFRFVGTMNDDVNTYVTESVRGRLMVTTNVVSLCQEDTQKQGGGLTTIYERYGTYIKSFYTVMLQPSSVVVAAMGDKHYRLHHRINWKATTPMILREDVRR